MQLTGDTVIIRTMSNDVFELTFNPAGTNGWLIDVYVAWDTYDEQYTWELNGTCLEDPEYNVDKIMAP